VLYARFYRVRVDQVDRLRGWMQEISRRRDEALASYIQKGTRHELYRRGAPDHLTSNGGGTRRSSSYPMRFREYEGTSQ
jgi:hypothetical protein